MLKVGITGGIGSGKSTVCKIFECLGVPVFHADEEGRRLLSEDAEVIKEVKQIWGEPAFTGGKPDRRKIASIVFNEPAKLTALNAIIHPRVRRAFHSWVKVQKSPLIIEEAAILFESGASAGLDKIIMVRASEHNRIERIMRRDNITEEKVRERMKNQWSEERKIEKSDYVIENDDMFPVIPQVIKVYNQLMAHEDSFTH